MVRDLKVNEVHVESQCLNANAVVGSTSVVQTSSTQVSIDNEKTPSMRSSTSFRNFQKTLMVVVRMVILAVESFGEVVA